jgi:hypothetical protein
MPAYLTKSECRSGQWFVVIYEIAVDGGMKELVAAPTGQPCGVGAKPPDIIQPPQAPQPHEDPPVTPRYVCVLEAEPAQRHAFPQKDSHKPSGTWAKLLQALDLLSDEPAGLDGCDWAYNIGCHTQSTDSSFICTVDAMGFVYHALGNSVDNYVLPYSAKLTCADGPNGCTIKVDDTGAAARHVGSCLTVELFPTWTGSGGAVQLQLDILVSLDASATGYASGPSGGTGGSAYFPGGIPGYRQKIGTYNWSCKHWLVIDQSK